MEPTMNETTPATPPPPPPPPEDPASEAAAEEEAGPLKRLHPDDLRFEAMVGGKKVLFIIPKNRPSLAYDLAMGVGVNKLFAYAAAIGVFWFGDKPRAAKQPYTHAVMWGQHVADDLFERGMSLSQIFELGKELIAYAFTTVPETQEEKEEAGFLG